MNEPRLLLAPLRYRQVEAHAEFGAGGTIEDLDGETRLLGPLAGERCQARRRHHSCGLVDQIARAGDGSCGDARARQLRGGHLG